jgi:hypothetical protein
MLGFMPNLRHLMATSPSGLTGWAAEHHITSRSVTASLWLPQKLAAATIVSPSTPISRATSPRSTRTKSLSTREGRSVDSKRQAAIMFAPRSKPLVRSPTRSSEPR